MTGPDGVLEPDTLRDDLASVLVRLAGATRPGGVLFATFKQGDAAGTGGDDWLEVLALRP